MFNVYIYNASFGTDLCQIEMDWVRIKIRLIKITFYIEKLKKWTVTEYVIHNKKCFKSF